MRGGQPSPRCSSATAGGWVAAKRASDPVPDQVAHPFGQVEGLVVLTERFSAAVTDHPVG